MPADLALEYELDVAQVLQVVMDRSRQSAGMCKKRSHAKADHRVNPNTTSHDITALKVWVAYVHHIGRVASAWSQGGAWQGGRVVVMVHFSLICTSMLPLIAVLDRFLRRK